MNKETNPYDSRCKNVEWQVPFKDTEMLVVKSVDLITLFFIARCVFTLHCLQVDLMFYLDGNRIPWV